MYRNDNLVEKHNKHWNYMFYNESHVQCPTEMAEHNCIVPFYHSCTVTTNMILKTEPGISFLDFNFVFTDNDLSNFAVQLMYFPWCNGNVTLKHHVSSHAYMVLLVWWHPIPDQLSQSLKNIKKKYLLREKQVETMG